MITALIVLGALAAWIGYRLPGWRARHVRSGAQSTRKSCP